MLDNDIVMKLVGVQFQLKYGYKGQDCSERMTAVKG